MNKSIKILSIVGCVLILGKQDLFPQRKSAFQNEYISKWERVLDLGKAIKEGSVKERMQVKDQILGILLKEEPNYPRVYVDQNASGSGDGSSWYNAFNDIQPAIDYLENNEEEGWIWVASGIYNPIIIASGIMVFGGFSGMESKLDERNYLEHETIIRNKNGPGPQGPSGVTMNHKTLIDGFTIRNCGFYNTPKHQLADNFVGGGIRTWSWFSIIRNNHIYNNKAASGSGIAAWGRHDYQRMEEYTPIIERNIIHHNSATCGAVVIHTSEVLFAHNIVCFNYCDILPNKSKGVEIDFNPNICDKPIVVNSILWGNTKRKFFAELYNHTSKVEQYGDAAKAISLYNCIQHKGYGEGLVKDDPLFVDPDNYNFQVKANSPCINAGYPDAPPDADNTRSDIGIFILQYCLTIIDSSRINPVSGQSFFPGSVVPISADSLVQDSAQTTQYLFHSWIGIGAGSYTGSVRDTSVCMDTSITEIINWDKNFRLEVSTDTDLDSCSGWYEEGREITLTLPSIIQLEEGVRKSFLGWQGKGEKIFSDQDTSITLTMNTPVQLSAVWQKEYLLTLDSEYDSPLGQGWYQEGDTVHISIDTLESEEQGIRYIFIQWQGTGDGSYTGVFPDTVVVMSNPITETADWKTQFFVEIESEYGNPQGEKWYDDQSMVHLSLDTVDSISPEVRARFIRWSGNGYSGSDPDPLFQITEPLNQRAEWQKEYWVDIKLDPVQGGEVKPFGEPGAWREANQTISFSVIENIKDGYGFYSWNGDTTSKNKQLNVTLSEPWHLRAEFKKGSVIISTVPSGLKIISDGVEYTEPMVFFWEPGEQHEIDVPSPQVFADTCRFTFSKWSTEATKHHSLKVDDELQRLTVYFNSEYHLNLESDYAEETIKGEGWYQLGDTAVVSIDSISPDSAGSRYRCLGWTGTVYIPDPQFNICINGPLFLRAEWIEQYLLKVIAIPPDSGWVELTPSGDWYDLDTEVELEAFPSNNRIEFVTWSGSVTSSENPLLYSMKQPSSIWAHFNSKSNPGPEMADIPDITMKEDSVYEIRVEDYVTHPRESGKDLDFSIQNTTHFRLDYNRDTLILYFIPYLHWFGKDSIILKVSDQWQISDQDTFIMEVLPVDDPPGEFSLLYPPNETVIIDTTDFLEFSWEQSREVDGETVFYDLFLGTDSLFEKGILLEQSNISNSNVILDVSNLHSTVYWRVLAKDKNNATCCSRPFRLTSVFKDWNISFDSYALYQNYPNPFNAETQITFYLPRSAKVTIKIIDTSGRVVSIIADDRFGKGVHVLPWKITNSHNYQFSSGIYILQAHLGSRILHKKMMVVK